MKTKTLFLSAVLGCLLWLPAASGAQAEPYQQYKRATCKGMCNLDFSVVPEGRRLIISYFSCHLEIPRGSNVHAMKLLVVNPDTVSVATLLPEGVDAGPYLDSKDVYAVNQSIFALANAGQRFQAHTKVELPGPGQVACYIGGDLGAL